jgi:hypothetical protein
MKEKYPDWKKSIRNSAHERKITPTWKKRNSAMKEKYPLMKENHPPIHTLNKVILRRDETIKTRMNLPKIKENHLQMK